MAHSRATSTSLSFVASRRQHVPATLAQLGVQFPAVFDFVAARVAVCACECWLAFLTSALGEVQLHPASALMEAR